MGQSVVNGKRKQFLVYNVSTVFVPCYRVNALTASCYLGVAAKYRNSVSS